MPPIDSASPVQEQKFHQYTGNRIPWYVHLLWILFWCFVAWYLVQFLLPMIPIELQSPP
ncbi:MAG: hypothetical protein ACKV0T_21475 [Planctomycetales bacterium]